MSDLNFFVLEKKKKYSRASVRRWEPWKLRATRGRQSSGELTLRFPDASSGFLLRSWLFASHTAKIPAGPKNQVGPIPSRILRVLPLNDFLRYRLTFSARLLLRYILIFVMQDGIITSYIEL